MTNPGLWGVTPGFHDVSGTWHPSSPEGTAAILHAMDAGSDDPPAPALVTIRLDHPTPPIGPGTLALEGGGEVRVAGSVPPDGPYGYHEFRPDNSPAYPLVLSPGRVPFPEGRIWGFAAQLYAARSRRSWGIGDLADLAALGEWSSGLGARLVLINPLHACTPTFPIQPSPYFAGSRCFANPIYLSVDDVPGSADIAGIAELAAGGRKLNGTRLIDRDRIWAIKRSALETIFDGWCGDSRFDSYLQERGASLERFAAFCALAEIHGPRWREWPRGLRHPDGAAVAAFAQGPGRPRVFFHAWMQWLLALQLERASESIGVMQDLAVGVDPDGADAWIWQGTFAPGMRVGAPPDEFNTQGQDWGLLPFDPWRLRSAGYAPWIDALRAGFRSGRGLRVDHVMGLFRLYWIPTEMEARNGVYVRYPHHDLLNLLALEADRAGAFVVGEDLGTVEEEVRRDLAERGVMSYRVWWFEDSPTSSWPDAAMGAVSTHDLPTVAGVVSGSDLEAQRRLGLQPNEESSARLRHKALDWTGSDDSTPLTEVIARVHRDLGLAPCAILSASLDDALAVEERPNIPGTTEEWPNWSIALPRSIEEFPDVELFGEIAAGMSRP